MGVRGNQPGSSPEGGTKTRERIDKGPGGISGNLTADPTLRYTPQGKAVASLRVAASERIKDKSTGEWRDGDAVFADVTVWGQLAENCAEHLRRGDRVVADGRWEGQAWEDDKGEVRERVVLVARDLGPSMIFRGAQVVRKEGRPS